MKALIWICAFIISVIAGVLFEALFRFIFPGFSAGYLFDIAFLILMLVIANKLCYKYDVNAFAKRAAAQGKTPGEYAQSVFPPSLLTICAEHAGDRDAFLKMLAQQVKADVITKADENVLTYMFDIGAFH